MDLSKVIQDLYAEKEKLERVIALLEEMQQKSASTPAAAKPVEHRGRKSMGSSERQEVSERMRRYWSSRQKQDQEKDPSPTTPPGRSTGPLSSREKGKPEE